MLLCPWDFPGKNTRVDCHFLLQRIFLTQELNPGLLHCRQILYWLSYEGVKVSKTCGSSGNQSSGDWFLCGTPDCSSSTRVWFWTGWPAALSLHPLSPHLPTHLRPQAYRDCGEFPLPKGSPLWTVELGARGLAAARQGAHVLMVSRNTPRLWLYPAGCPRSWPAVLPQVLPWTWGVQCRFRWCVLWVAPESCSLRTGAKMSVFCLFLDLFLMVV